MTRHRLAVAAMAGTLAALLVIFSGYADGAWRPTTALASWCWGLYVAAAASAILAARTVPRRR